MMPSSEIRRILLYGLQFVLGFGVFVYLIWPLLVSEHNFFKGGNYSPEQQRKDKVLEALRDLEYEHETGKISASDYSRLSDHYLDRAVELFGEGELEEIELETADSETDLSAKIEEKIARYRENLG